MKWIEAITHNFHVNATSQFLPERSNTDTPIFFFTYWISISNKSEKTAQLINRYWHITDAEGRINEVNGEGVVGKQPYIEPRQTFEYKSFCPLTTEFALMHGHYTMIEEDETSFQIEIPQFHLSPER